MLEDNDLIHTKYPVDILIKNINRLSIKNLLYYQKLTAEFCAKYILSKNSACCNEEEYITLKDVLEIQNHLTEEEIKKYV
jgi:hypothetical protein